jgi:Putative translation initiation inhibitor, yjgF family
MKYTIMESDKVLADMNNVRLDCARFAHAPGADESFAMVRVTRRDLSFGEQLDALFGLLGYYLGEKGSVRTAVFIRFFLSDAANQEAELLRRWELLGIVCPVSVVQQPPLDGTRLSAWVYTISGAEVTLDGPLYKVHTAHYNHYWMVNAICAESDSHHQTTALLEGYEEALKRVGCDLPNHCVRTWFFVQNVDVNYHGVVVGRRENFMRIGLNEHTHYIASTGIEGRSADPKAYVGMDAYAVAELQPGQQQYLYAHTHLNPTSEYGVTFERGVKVKYGDRSHLYISGTASINNKGEVVHVGDIRKQTERMWENVEMLLREGGASFDDVAQMFVYLRDMADYEVVGAMFEERFPMVPKVILLAPVCRPAWLIEMECMAVVREVHPEYRIF